MAEADDDDELDDIENIADKMVGKKRSKKAVKISLEDNLELEYENEDISKGSAMKGKKQKISNSNSKSNSKIDF